MRAGLLVPAEGPGSWADAAASGAGEEDRRRFPYHRRLHNAAKDGNTSAAEAAFASMGAAGLPPGPRAYHVLLCCHLKAGDLPGALAVTARATDAGVQLLPESYAALIYSHMELSPPDVALAKALYGALPGTGSELQAPWAVLCRLLAAKGFAADAVAAVREGLEAGLLLDEDVAEAYIMALCDTEQADAALKVLETARSRHGFTPEPRHVNYVVAAYALAGNFTDAAGLTDAAGSRGWGRDAGSFNALLAGMVQELRQLLGGGEEPSETLITDFSMTRPRMLQSGVRPDKFTFKLEAEGHVVLRDACSAMAAVKSMRNMAGAMGCRLLEPQALSGLLSLLCEQDMPVDLLQLLVYMSEDSCRLPPGSLAADAQGRSLLSRWVVGHLEGMATRAEAREASQSMAAAETQYIDGVAIGRGQCVVDDDGLIVPVSKCSMKELRAEAAARGAANAADMRRPELSAAIKAARARLPFNVLQAQVTSARAQAGRKTAAKPAAAGKRKGARAFYREQWTIDERFDLQREQLAREVMGAEQFLLEGRALDALDATDDQYGVASLKAMMGVNFEAVMEARMLDEGTAAILNVGDEDVTTGFATLLPGAGDEEEEDEEDDEGPKSKEGGELDDRAWRAMEREADGVALGNGTENLQEGYNQLVMMEAQQIDTDEANIIAGMDIAMDVVRAAEICGGGITAADVLTLASGAQAERSPAAAAAVAARMSVLLQPGVVDGSTGQQYSREFVLQQYEQLADMCLRFRAPVFADAILEAAETQGLRPSPDIMQRLMVAMRGKPRRSERVSRESAALLDRAGIDTAAEDDDEQMRMQQQQQQQLAAAAATDVAALSAVERPLLGPAGSSQQQQQDAEEGEEMELSEDMAEVADLLKGVSVGALFRERMEEALTTGGGGLSPDDAADVMDQPEMLLVDLASWLPQELMDTDEDSEDEEEDAAAATGQTQQQQGGEEQMTLLQLAHVSGYDPSMWRVHLGLLVA
ncbi:hypothetical protein COO60DRAFT_743720 [Scenedesmus sp. NREL 46B-D3]|nr:hypothetical protein COO60DRAFT_743720 [Scenedesmus sp. NREL 46B-D3]